MDTVSCPYYSFVTAWILVVTTALHLIPTTVPIRFDTNNRCEKLNLVSNSKYGRARPPRAWPPFLHQTTRPHKLVDFLGSGKSIRQLYLELTVFSSLINAICSDLAKDTRCTDDVKFSPCTVYSDHMNYIVVEATSLYPYCDDFGSVRTRCSTENIFSRVFEIIANSHAFPKFYKSTLETHCPRNTDLAVI